MMASIARSSYIKDPYHVLGILPTAEQTEIKKAYRVKAKMTHPDRNPINEKATWERSFHEVHEAYEILSNPQRRKDYDEYMNARRAAGADQFEISRNKVKPNPQSKKILKTLKMVLRFLLLDFE
jgi:curved DNA-binding protein CbpA